MIHLRADELTQARALLRMGQRKISDRLARREPPERHRAKISVSGVRLSLRQAERLARATHDLGFDPSDATLPRYADGVWLPAAFLELIVGSGIPLSRQGVVHLGGSRRYLRETLFDEPHLLLASVRSVRPSRKGLMIDVEATLKNRMGQPCRTSLDTVLVMGVDPDPDLARREVRPLDAEWRPIDGWTIDGGAGRRYARASGDWNPIHLSRATAMPLGFSRPILHGFCTEAMVMNSLVEHLTDGTGGISHLEIDLIRPLAIPGAVQLRVASAGGDRHFRLDDGDVDGKPYAVGTFSIGDPQG